MTRAEKREMKRKLKKEIVEFLKIQNHYFPKLIEDIKKYWTEGTRATLHMR